MAEILDGKNLTTDTRNAQKAGTSTPSLTDTPTPSQLPTSIAAATSIPPDQQTSSPLPGAGSSSVPVDTSLPPMKMYSTPLSANTSLPPLDVTLHSTKANLNITKKPAVSTLETPYVQDHQQEFPTPTAANPQSQPTVSHFQPVNGSLQPQALPRQHASLSPEHAGGHHNTHRGSAPIIHTVGGSQSTTTIQSGHIPEAPIGSPLPSGMPPVSSGSHQMPGYPTTVSPMAMAYPTPGDFNKLTAAGRQKKEVKRRTKTGCLTCRKRRIKCDETHPVCRNCIKSKRECLGYDPIFKQPAATTPSAIQPALNTAPSLVVNSQDSATATGSIYAAAPPGYMPATSQPFTSSLHSESPPTSTEQFDHQSSTDFSANSFGNSDRNTGKFIRSNMAGFQDTPDNNLQLTLEPVVGPEGPSFKVKQVQIDDLLALRGISPPPSHPITPLQPNRLEEIQAVFLATYAPAIDRFFETRWFQEKALPHLMANAQLMAEYSALIDAFNDPNLSDPNVVARLESFEASVIWTSMTLCRQAMKATDPKEETGFDLQASSKRLDTIEALITGEYLESNPLAPHPVREFAANPPSLPDQLSQRSLDFWNSIGHFLTLHDDEASSAKEIDDTLGRARTLLDTYENRDVIYSIAIARHLGQRWADFPRSFPQPITTNEKDAGAKLYVAQKFLEDEASGKGTTQVIKRICGMVLRSWIVSRE